MEAPRIIEHKGKSIIYLDFSDIDTLADREPMMENVEKAKAIIRQLPLASGLTLTNATNLRFNSDIINTLKDLAEHNKPHVKAGALVGVTGLQKMMYDFIMKMTKRNLPIFPTIEEAMDWLVQQ